MGHRLGASALRDANDLLGHPRARRYHQHRPGTEQCVVANVLNPFRAIPASPSAPPSLQFLGGRRIQRLGLGPRSRLRRPFDRPGLRTGESASMGPTNTACRLLQLKHDVRARFASDGPRSVTKAATFFTCCTRGVVSACGGGPAGREPRTLEKPPQRRFPP